MLRREVLSADAARQRLQAMRAVRDDRERTRHLYWSEPHQLWVLVERAAGARYRMSYYQGDCGCSAS